MVISVMSAAVGVWFYLEDLRGENSTWYDDDKIWNEQMLSKLDSVIANQAKINTVLATQGVQLTELEATVNRNYTQQNFRFEQLEDEHKIITSAIYSVGVDIAYSLGVHEGKHHSGVHLME